MSGMGKWFCDVFRLLVVLGVFAPLSVFAHNDNTQLPSTQHCPTVVQPGDSGDNLIEYTLPVSGTELHCHHTAPGAGAVGKLSRQDSDGWASEAYPAPPISWTPARASVFEAYHPLFTVRPRFILYGNFRS